MKAWVIELKLTSIGPIKLRTKLIVIKFKRGT